MLHCESDDSGSEDELSTKRMKRTGPDFDCDIDIQYSDNETDSIPSDLSEANSILDDDFVDHDNECQIVLDTECRTVELANLEAVFSKFVNDSEDIEMTEIRTKLLTMSVLDKLTVMHSLSLPLSKLKRTIETDEVIRALPPTQTSGFESLMYGIDRTADIKRLLSCISQHILMVRSNGYAQMKLLGQDIFEYFFGDLRDEMSVESYISQRICKMLELFAINSNTLNEIVSCRNPPSAVVVKTVTIKPATITPTPVVQYSLEDVMSEEFDDSPLPSQITRPRLLHQSRNLKTPQCTDCEILVWRADDAEEQALREYKSEINIVNRNRNLTQELSRLPDPFNSAMATSILCYQMPNYEKIVVKLMDITKCTLGTARKWAWDITQAKNRSVMKWLKQPIIDSNSSANVSTTLDSENDNKCNDLVYYPSSESVSMIFRNANQDERFLLLPIGWKIRDGCPSGIFQHIPQMTSNVKYVLFVIFGGDNVMRFSENITQFVKFNADSSRIAKCGMYATVNCPGTLRGIPVCQMTYVILTMGRAAQLKDVAKEIVWFCKSIQIEGGDCLLEIFNNQEHCGECYKDCDDFRKELDGGFIGPVDVKWRKKLKITDDDSQNSRAFQIIFEHFDDYKIKNIPEAVALVNQIVNSPDDSEFKSALVSLIGNATAVKQSIQVALWWNIQRQKHMPVFGRSNKGLIVSKMANLLFRRIARICGGHLLDPSVTVSDWDEDMYGPIKYKGTLRQFQIMDLIQEMRTDRSNLLYILKKNGINPSAFYNVVCSRMILAGRRNRLTIFSGPKRSGKSIVAGALSLAFDGARVPVDVQGGRDFKIDGAMTDQIGMVILEDVQANTFQTYIDKNLRAHLDGDKVMLNQKMKETSEGAMRSCVITTNERDDSDSDNEATKSPSFTLKRRSILDKRYKCVRFRAPLTAEDPFIESLTADDILVFLFRYGLYPLCNQLYNGPVCDMSPCTGITYGEHNPLCPLLCSIHSNLQTNVSLHHETTSNTIKEYYEQVDSSLLGILFDIKDSGDVCEMMRYQMRVSMSDIQSCRDGQLLQTKHELLGQIEQFIDYVWRPLCYSSAYMRGQYLSGEHCRWAHSNILTWDLFKPHLQPDDLIPTIADATTCSNPAACVELCWSASLKLHPRYVQFVTEPQAFHITDKIGLLRLVAQYIKRTQPTKRFKSVARRLLSIAYNKARQAIVCDSTFNELWLSLLKRRVDNAVPSPAKVSNINMSFYD